MGDNRSKGIFLFFFLFFEERNKWTNRKMLRKIEYSTKKNGSVQKTQKQTRTKWTVLKIEWDIDQISIEKVKLNTVQKNIAIGNITAEL